MAKSKSKIILSSTGKVLCLAGLVSGGVDVGDVGSGVSILLLFHVLFIIHLDF